MSTLSLEHRSPSGGAETCNVLPGICRSSTILDVHRARKATLTKAEVQIQHAKRAQQLCEEERKAKRQQQEEFNRDCARAIAERLGLFHQAWQARTGPAFANHHARDSCSPSGWTFYAVGCCERQDQRKVSD